MLHVACVDRTQDGVRSFGRGITSSAASVCERSVRVRLGPGCATCSKADTVRRETQANACINTDTGTGTHMSTGSKREDHTGRQEGGMFQCGKQGERWDGIKIGCLWCCHLRGSAGGPDWCGGAGEMRGRWQGKEAPNRLAAPLYYMACLQVAGACGNWLTMKRRQAPRIAMVAR